ncbi:MAG: transcriptional repressor [Nitrospira sp. CR1.3]|nr:transcriptional repressor [Nitrospira sp. CR1.3]
MPYRLNHSRQRNLILAILAERDHASARDLHGVLAEQGHRVSLGTVYRNMRLFCKMGLAEARYFGDQVQYDYTASKGRHDHLICTLCGQIVEFDDPEIGRLRRAVAETHGFSLLKEKLDLYGLCAVCRERKGPRPVRQGVLRPAALT